MTPISPQPQADPPNQSRIGSIRIDDQLNLLFLAFMAHKQFIHKQFIHLRHQPIFSSGESLSRAWYPAIAGVGMEFSASLGIPGQIPG